MVSMSWIREHAAHERIKFSYQFEINTINKKNLKHILKTLKNNGMLKTGPDIIYTASVVF